MTDATVERTPAFGAVWREQLRIAGLSIRREALIAATLLGLNQLWNLLMDRHDLHRVGATLGADVPFFLEGGTAIGTGRVILGSNVLQYSGFARMCVEYVVESIRRHRPLDLLEFHLLLARN